jgi:ABC-type transport system involved in multi-copper enzyme maturation permease subunit
MRLSTTASTICWLVRDTFRQSLSSGIFWILLVISLLTIGVCLSAGVQGEAQLAAPGENPEFLPRHDRDAKDPEKAKKDNVPVVSGELTLGFGALSVPLARDGRAAVHGLQLILAGGVADTMGLLLTLVWTAGFLPGFLDRRNVSVLLAKPASRWCLLMGKYVGVLAFVLLQSVIFVGGTWLALGVRTGVWNASYLLSVPILLLHFAIFFSFSLLLAVCTRSTVVCVFGSVVFWFLCWGMNYGRHAVVTAAHLAPESAFSAQLAWLANVGYWVLPKPADFSLLLFDALDAHGYFSRLFDVDAVRQSGFFSIELSIVTSLLFTVYLLIASARQFATTDY